jgi:hypothetical protein
MRRSTAHLFGLAALLLYLLQSSSSLQAQQVPTLVIDGGTLIDGNGGPPVANALIVIQGNRITSVSRRGQVSYPPTAQVIRADGKFILPGYWENENVYKWYVGESLLNNGVTSVTDIGEGGEILMLHREAVNRGKINGPRLFTGIARIGPLGFDTNTGFETSMGPGQLPKSVDDARAIAKRMLAAGADVINWQGGNYPVEYYKAAIEEGLKAGKPAFVRPGGPTFYPKDAALAGATILSQAAGIAIALAKDPKKWTAGGIVSATSLDKGANLAINELDVYSDMDDAKAAELIRLLVDRKVSVQINIIRKGKGFHKYNERFQDEARKWWHSNPGLRAYYPEEMFESELLEMTADELEPAVFERRKAGYDNLLRFAKQFVQAGGHLLPGCNAPFIRPPGLCLHQELQNFADAGLTPTQLVQAATKWSAEAYGVSDKLGTVEAGKLADLVILRADPLQNHQNLQAIDAVIYDGKVQKLGYHAEYPLSQPFQGGRGLDMNLIVEDLAWVAALKQATFRESGAMPTAPPGGPVRVDPPAIETISPAIVKQGSPATITINGFNFFDRCIVYFNNVIVPYRRVSRTQLEVTLNQNLLQQPGVFEILVKTPGPLINQQSWRARDGFSNKARLLVDFKY